MDDLPDLQSTDPQRARLLAGLIVGGILLALDLGLIAWALITV